MKISSSFVVSFLAFVIVVFTTNYQHKSTVSGSFLGSLKSWSRILNFGLIISGKADQDNSYVDSPFTIFDEYGSMPSFEDTYKVILDSSPIVVISGSNFTVVAFKYNEVIKCNNYNLNPYPFIFI